MPPRKNASIGCYILCQANTITGDSVDRAGLYRGSPAIRRTNCRAESEADWPLVRLLLLRGWCHRLLRRGGLRFDRLRLDVSQNGGRSAAPGCVHRQRDGSDHERHSRPGGSFGKRAGRAARSERRLAALTAESRGNVAALAALQQNHNDDEEADQDVDRRDEVDHRFGCCPNAQVMLWFQPQSGGVVVHADKKPWCGRGDLNYSITLITRNLLILHPAKRPKCPTIPLPLYVYCTANAHRRENRAEALSLNPANNSLTPATPIGQGHHRLRRRGPVVAFRDLGGTTSSSFGRAIPDVSHQGFLEQYLR